MANAPVFLNAVNSTLLPPIITGPIFKKASEQSAVQQLARKVPLAVNATTAIPVPMDVPTADWVVEGAVKPVGSAGMGVKTMTGKKLALLVPVSQELVMTNPGGIYDQLEQDLPTAMGRAFDYAAIHGASLKNPGNAGPFSSYLAQTTITQVIGASASTAGGAYADLVLGMQKIVNGPIQGYEFSGFAADPRLKPELMLSVDNVGRPLAYSQDQGAISSSFPGQTLIGYPAAYNTGVSGKYYRQGDTVQIVTLTGATGGTFTLNIVGQTTSALAYNASAATVQTAIQALGTAASAGATVTGSTGGPYTVTFAQSSAPIYASGALLTGTTPTATVAQSPNADTGLRAIGGDWSQCAWGQGMDITMKISTEANYWDGSNWHSAFQENLVLLLVEAYYGFVVNDVNAFCAYTHSAGS